MFFHPPKMKTKSPLSAQRSYPTTPSPRPTVPPKYVTPTQTHDQHFDPTYEVYNAEASHDTRAYAGEESGSGRPRRACSQLELEDGMLVSARVSTSLIRAGT